MTCTSSGIFTVLLGPTFVILFPCTRMTESFCGGEPVPSMRFPHFIALIDIFFAVPFAVFVLIYLAIHKWGGYHPFLGFFSVNIPIFGFL